MSTQALHCRSGQGQRIFVTRSGVDCGQCVNCLHKPKFGAPNKRRQAYLFLQVLTAGSALIASTSPSSVARTRGGRRVYFDKWSPSSFLSTLPLPPLPPLPPLSSRLKGRGAMRGDGGVELKIKPKGPRHPLFKSKSTKMRNGLPYLQGPLTFVRSPKKNAKAKMGDGDSDSSSDDSLLKEVIAATRPENWT